MSAPTLISGPILLPTISAGETLYSWCATVHRRACSLSTIATSKALFGKPNAARLHDFPGFLGELTSRTEGLVGDPKELALGHSLMGYFLAFTPEERGRVLLDGVIHGSVPDIKMKLGIPASGIGGYHPLKCCEKCIQSDIESQGWPIWHLVHQLPSVLVCGIHQRPLVLHWDDITPVHRRAWIKPSTAHSPQRFEIPIADDRTLDLLLRLADISEKTASSPPGTLTSDQLARAYQYWAANNSAFSPGNSIRHTVMTSALTRSFDQICSSLAGMGPASCKPQLGSIIGAVARTKPRPAHPLKHLVLIACMFGNWDAFWAAHMDEASSHGDSTPHAPALPKWNPNEENGTRFAQLVREENLSIRQASDAFGISTSTGVRWAKIHDLAYTPRTRTLTTEFLEKVRQHLRTGIEKVEVIAKTEISSVSLNRLLSSEPSLRAQWLLAKEDRLRSQNREKFLTTLKNHPGVPIWLLRKLANTGWAWLYRHDRAWLKEIIPTLWQEPVDDL